GDLGLVHRLVRQHRLADHVPDREDVRHASPHLLAHRDEAGRIHGHPGPFGPYQGTVGRRPTATRIRSKVSVAGALAPSNETARPSGLASTPVTRVRRKTFSYSRATRLASGATTSRSAPGMSWSSSSTTVIRAPSSW